MKSRFLTALLTGPVLRADAIVVLCGEDALPRTEVAVQLLRQGAAPVIVLSGGKDSRPRWVSAPSLGAALLAKGVAPDRILIEHASQNTKEQARNVIELAVVNEWTSLCLVASSYHLPRAFLTFVKALGDTAIRLVPVACSQSPWTQAPTGMTETRAELLTTEFAKIDEYQAKGDVASYADGLAYLTSWEGR